jgi:alkyldihydroxyacetonephosphate synthase
MQYGGSISHHHSVGADHQKWYKKYTDSLALDVLRAVKNKLDPKGIMNSGKLFS